MNESSKNRVQLIGLVYKQPKLFEFQQRQYVRLLVEVDETDEEGQFFSSYHPVVVLEEVAYAGGEIRIGDIVLAEGRLNNYVIRDGDIVKKRGTNVQATTLLLLRQASHRVQEIPGFPKGADDGDNDVVMAQGGNVVSLFGVKDDEVDGEPPF